MGKRAQFLATSKLKSGKQRSDQVWFVGSLHFLFDFFRKFFSLTYASRSFDTDPLKRRQSPSLYGYIPDEGLTRALLLFIMTLNSALLLSLRSFSVAALIMTDLKYYAWYSAADIGIYIAQKIARRDFSYWIPVEGGLEIVLSFFSRVIVKIISDYTAMVHFRHVSLQEFDLIAG